MPHAKCYKHKKPNPCEFCNPQEAETVVVVPMKRETPVDPVYSNEPGLEEASDNDTQDEGHGNGESYD